MDAANALTVWTGSLPAGTSVVAAAWRSPQVLAEQWQARQASLLWGIVGRASASRLLREACNTTSRLPRSMPIWLTSWQLASRQVGAHYWGHGRSAEFFRASSVYLDDIVVVGQHSRVAVEHYISRKQRATLAEATEAALAADGGSIDLSQLRRIEQKLLQLITVRYRFYLALARADPVTARDLVLGFALWTGCPPPLAEKHVEQDGLCFLREGSSVDQTHSRPPSPPGPSAWNHRRHAEGICRNRSRYGRRPFRLPLVVRRNIDVRRSSHVARTGNLSRPGRREMVDRIRMGSPLGRCGNPTA